MSEKPTYEELEQRVKHMEALIKNSQIATVQLTEDNIITEINPEFTRLFGFEQEDVVGKYIDPLLAPQEYREEAEQLSRQTIEGDTIHKVSKRRRKDGILRDVEIFAGSLKVSGKVVGSYGQYKDITGNKEIEDALRTSEERFRTIFEKAAVGILIVDMKARKYLKVNPAFQAMSGYQPEELFRMSPHKLTLIDDWAFEKKLLLDLSSGKRDQYQLQKRYKKKDGGYFWGHATVTLVCDNSGNPDYTVTIVEDITERKQAETALQESEKKYRAILEGIEDSYLEVDLAGNFQFFNDSFCKMLGYPKDELIGMNNRDLLDKANAKKVYQIFTEVYNTEKPAIGVDWEIIRKDGTKRYVETSVSLIRDQQGQRIGFRGIGRDVTEKKQMESELIQTKNFLQNILDSSVDGIVTTDLHGKIIFGSPATAIILGYDMEEIAGEKVYSFYSNGIKDAKTIMKELIGKSGLKEHDIILVRKDGELININLSAAPLKNEKGEMIGTLGILRDTTDKMRMEAQLQQAQKMKTIGTLAGGVAHDLNNILSGIVSYPELILMDLPEDSPLRKPILTMQQSGEKAAVVVQDLLTLARRGVAIAEVVNLNNIISEQLKSPEFKKLKSFHPDVQVKTRFENDLLNIKGSSAHLSKSVMNLISNAAEAMPDGGTILISTENRYIDRPIRRYDHVEEGEYMTVTVSDTGIGISSEDIKRIFEPFYTKKVMGRSGTGLGMAVVWGTVKDHKGYIDVESSEGKGTTFTLYFPITREIFVKEETRLPIEDYMGKGESILAVDDVEEQRELAFKMLNKLGYSAHTVSSGEEAVEYMEKNKADLIVLDMIMDPGIDGLETYNKILEFHPEQKAIIASGFSETDRVKEVQRLGVGQYIKKPYTLEKIGLAVKKELGK
jgi:PAS domain S-box-containing protein